MTCGLRFASAGAAPAAFCIWSDGSTLSEVSVYRGTVPAAHAIALAVRAANGH
jgi:hypothetical protein